MAGARGSPAVPDLPTVAKSVGGLRGYDASLWYDFMAPAGTSDNVTSGAGKNGSSRRCSESARTQCSRGDREHTRGVHRSSQKRDCQMGAPARRVTHVTVDALSLNDWVSGSGRTRPHADATCRAPSHTASTVAPTSADFRKRFAAEGVCAEKSKPKEPAPGVKWRSRRLCADTRHPVCE